MANTLESIRSERDLIKYLQRSHSIRAELRAINRRMVELRARAESVSPSYSLTPKSPNNGDGKVAHYALEIVTLQEDAEERAVNLVRAEKEIENLILSLEPSKTRAIMYDYYVNDIPICSTDEEKATLEKIYNYTERYLMFLLHNGRMDILDILNHGISSDEGDTL